MIVLLVFLPRLRALCPEANSAAANRGGAGHGQPGASGDRSLAVCTILIAVARSNADSVLVQRPSPRGRAAGRSSLPGPAVVERLSDADKFTGTHFLRHQLVTDGGRSPGGPLTFLPGTSPRAAKPSTTSSGKRKKSTGPPRVSVHPERKMPPRVCAFQLSGPCRAACRDKTAEQPPPTRGRFRTRARRRLQWVPYGPEPGAGGVWGCEGCEAKRRKSNAAALSAVLMAAGASAYAAQLCAEGITTVDALDDWSDGELRSIGIPTPVVKRLRRASGMRRPAPPVRMAPGSGPILAKSRRVAKAAKKGKKRKKKEGESKAKTAAVDEMGGVGPTAPLRMDEATAKVTTPPQNHSLQCDDYVPPLLMSALSGAGDRTRGTVRCPIARVRENAPAKAARG